MNSKDDPRGVLKKRIPSSTNEISSLKQQMVEMQLEIDILKDVCCKLIIPGIGNKNP